MKIIGDKKLLSGLTEPRPAAFDQIFANQFKHSLDDEFLSSEQAAALLEVSQSTITRYVKNGRLKAEKIRGKYRIKQEDVINLALKND